ncbi:hypothetical protein PTSG_12535 [Salpingoeca rosetta]|uniref:Uncharacterized protein n=1 Tax=Salpingoeca rosetta (strain ATCC 50818 / BSB-021) TaxID=946362 RepID=F2UE17_SALR5|nr:uncharacterized protein PTSG_12535 [Salpingoeca rosetta]EGD74867.1 hypothetical protein PTSG_12535 [Salpingoeca rosetta]|eukprot:XP_004992512.1 hypothetical protein PTSG_12535 [Salpingoeca rosetta]
MSRSCVSRFNRLQCPFLSLYQPLLIFHTSRRCFKSSYFVIPLSRSSTPTVRVCTSPSVSPLFPVSWPFVVDSHARSIIGLNCCLANCLIQPPVNCPLRVSV